MQCCAQSAWTTVIVYGSDWFGEVVYGGDPDADDDSDAYQTYESGVELGNFG